MTDIIVTMGPAINNPQKLTELFKQGVRILRFNFPHFNHKTALESIRTIRQVEKKIKSRFKLLLDTAGPEIRTGYLQSNINYCKGEKFKIFIDESSRGPKDLFCTYNSLIEDVKIGGIIKIDAGLLEVKILSKGSDFVLVKALQDFSVGSRRHINLPGIHYNLPTITEKDKKDIVFAIEQKFDFIALSFVRSAGDISQMRYILASHQANNIQIVAKIENQEGIEHIDDIIDHSDLVMVARGDLGTELPVETIPAHQMNIVKKCKIKNTPVIVATQILESMICNAIPTRAEISDIFYAVVEGTDYLMLSGETAIGQYPIQSVNFMKKTIKQAQKF